MCSANVIYFGEFIKGWHLVRARKNGRVMKKRDWGLVRANDPEFIFSTIPVKDHDSDSKHNKFLDELVKFIPEIKNTPGMGYKLVEAFTSQNKYKRTDPYFEYFLFDYLAKFIQKAKASYRKSGVDWMDKNSDFSIRKT
jgi:hypothetical protein